VVLSTLLLLGITLPWEIKKLKIPEYPVAAEEYVVQNQVVTEIIAHI
jgi:CPA1 family monovalent cation:H+ antiporter